MNKHVTLSPLGGSPVPRLRSLWPPPEIQHTEWQYQWGCKPLGSGLCICSDLTSQTAHPGAPPSLQMSFAWPTVFLKKIFIKWNSIFKNWGVSGFPACLWTWEELATFGLSPHMATRGGGDLQPQCCCHPTFSPLCAMELPACPSGAFEFEIPDLQDF